jgi:membrane associated rhomboid family serine protease
MVFIAVLLTSALVLVGAALSLPQSGGIDWPQLGILAAATFAFGTLSGVLLGIPSLWLARRIAPGSVVVLTGLGALTGLLSGLLVAGGSAATQSLAVLGAVLGAAASFLWWVLVERKPELRAKYD